MLLPGREWQEGYRFDFYGMEMELGIVAASNGYDFGNRIYNAKIGRWLRLDPLAKPDISAYSFSYNCPIIIIDPDGRDEVFYLTVVNNKTGTTQVYLINVKQGVYQTDVTVKASSVKLFGRNISTHDTHKVMGFYNIIHNNVLTVNEDGTVSLDKSDERTLEYTRSYFKIFRSLGKFFRGEELSGDGDEQRWGWVFTSKYQGADPTKATAVHTYKTMSIDEVTELFEILNTAVGLHSLTKSQPNPHDIEDWAEAAVLAYSIYDSYIREHPESKGELDEIISSTENSWPSGEVKGVCPACLEGNGKLSSPHGSGELYIPKEVYDEYKSKEVPQQHDKE